MFTGLVEAIGEVQKLDSNRLILTCPMPAPADWEPFRLGESISVNGVCLTLVDDVNGLQFDLSEETLARTTLGSLKSGQRVNVERALRLGDRLGGHFVQGHVDGVGSVVNVVSKRDGATITFHAPMEKSFLLVDKGSVTVDGISLTVVNPRDSGIFDVAVIPTTWAKTTLQDRQEGDSVNLELDMIAKHISNLTKPYLN